MQSDVAFSTKVLQQVLDTWKPYSLPVAQYAELHEELTQYGCDGVEHLLGSLERYIQWQRMDLLGKEWGCVSDGTPAQAEKITVPRDIMIRLNGVLGFYGVPRTAIFLYVHAYLFDALDLDGPWEELMKVVDQLDPR